MLVTRYPSLLESSDIDGGSAVAVLTYVRVILDTLEHPDIIHLILSYLMALHEVPETPTTAPPTPSVARRRKSLDLLSMAYKSDSRPSPDLFNLVDLILTSLKSRSQQTVAATLRLVSIILRKHHSYSISTLLKVRRIDESAPKRTIGAHTKEMKIFFAMINRIGADDDSGTDSYEAYLKDNLELLECHPCSANALEIKNPQESSRSESIAKDLYTHTLRLDDPLLKIVVGLLTTFFSNSVETNLILTCVIIDLASCCYMKPEGWLWYDPVHYEYDEDSDEEFEEEWEELIAEGEMGDGLLEELERKQMKGLKRARKEPRWKETPPVMEVLQSLTKQIEAYRREVYQILCCKLLLFDIGLILYPRFLISTINYGSGKTPFASQIISTKPCPARALALHLLVVQAPPMSSTPFCQPFLPTPPRVGGNHSLNSMGLDTPPLAALLLTACHQEECFPLTETIG